MNRFVLVALGHVLLLSTKISYNKLKIAYDNTHIDSNRVRFPVYDNRNMYTVLHNLSSIISYNDP